jgi:hypothetical protein
MELLAPLFRAILYIEQIDVFRLLLADPAYLAFLASASPFQEH